MSDMGTEVVLLLQVSVIMSQVVPCGQQWNLSQQHTACRQNSLTF